MNCLDYRRQLLAGAGESDAMRVHRLQCAGCAAERAQHGAFEDEVRAALQVGIPDGFAERMALSPQREPGKQGAVGEC